MIKENVREILEQLPADVQLVVAAKSRTADEIQQAVAAGARIIGENYVQEAEKAYVLIGSAVKWHFIGSLQKNKVKKAVRIFDMIETIDNQALAEEVDKRCAREDKLMPVLVEVNSGRERQKHGIFPEEVESLIRLIAPFKNIRIKGLMTMGPELADAELIRPYFAETKRLFDKIGALDIPGVEMKYLSMGMTDSYRVALEEGANIVRIGSAIFGERNASKKENSD